MKKILTALLTAAASVAFGAAPHLWFRRKTRRKAAETRPKVEAVLDEMIRIVSEWKGPLDRVIFNNETEIVNDERRERDLSIQAGGDLYHLDVSVRLEGKKAGRVQISLSRRRGDQVLRLAWPDYGEYWPPEPWLTERLERLDLLAGNASRRRSIAPILKRFGVGKDDDEGGSNTN